MKTWQEFNDAVNDMLLVDGIRKGRGVERFRDRMIVSGVRDLQTYIPELRTVPEEISFTKDELTVHSEGKAMIGSLDVEAARVLDIVVRALPEKMDEPSKYYRPHLYPAYKRYSILDGGTVRRTPTYPGKIVFDRGQFITAPLLEENEILTILYNQEYAYRPIFECSVEEKEKKVPFSDDAVLAVHYFVKYHFSRDVNDDQNKAQTDFQNYQRERRKISVSRSTLIPTVNPSETLSNGSFVVGNG